jgi:transposase InsO family protein
MPVGRGTVQGPRPPSLISPTTWFRPQSNGKAERCNKTLLREWVYGRRYDTNQARLDALPGFID